MRRPTSRRGLLLLAGLLVGLVVAIGRAEATAAAPVPVRVCEENRDWRRPGPDEMARTVWRDNRYRDALTGAPSERVLAYYTHHFLFFPFSSASGTDHALDMSGLKTARPRWPCQPLHDQALGRSRDVVVWALGYRVLGADITDGTLTLTVEPNDPALDRGYAIVRVPRPGASWTARFVLPDGREIARAWAPDNICCADEVDHPAPPAPAAAAQEPTVSKTDLFAVGGSRVYGVAVLEAVGQQTRVSVALVGAPAGAAFSASVRAGTCWAPGPVVFALGTTARAPDGADRLVATVDALLASALASSHSVRIDAPMGQAVACGELALTAAARQQRAALAGTDASTALTHFIEARFEHRYSALLELLTDELRRAVTAPPGGAGVRELTPATNPCWYRYAVEAFDQPTPAAATARVRVYEHQWPGDVAGTVPRSWEQEIGLVRTPEGWRVGRLGQPGPWRDEPDEPHGPTTSACNVGRRPGVWLAAALPRTGGIPAPALPAAGILGAGLAAAGLALRSRH